VVNAPAKGGIRDEPRRTASWKENYFARILDVVTQYEPDLLYTTAAFHSAMKVWLSSPTSIIRARAGMAQGDCDLQQ